MSKWKSNNAHKTSKYKSHFWIAEANKLRRIAKQKRKEEKHKQKLLLRESKWIK